MDVVQWLVPLSDRDDLAVCFAPAWADRLPATAGLPALRRRSSPLVCKHLVRPVAVAVPADVADDDRPTRLSGAPGALALRIQLSAEGGPLLGPTANDVRFASVMAEFVGVAVDVVEAAGLPLMGAMPVDERRALQLLLGGLQGTPCARFADALVLFGGAVEFAAHARGFDAACFLVEGTALHRIDGRIEGVL